ncbi:hypothetical protein BH11PLA2_BH11PLA2_22450 [soil metagenome]
MIRSLRLRLLLAITPILLLLAALGGVGTVMLHRTGERIDAIMRENYVSVHAMFQLNEALERIDSSFQFSLAGQGETAALQYQDNWKAFDNEFAVEAANITIHPREDELVARLQALKTRYRDEGNQFYARPAGSPQRTLSYFGEGGLHKQFREIKAVSGQIVHINRENMEAARDDAKASARTALIGFGISLAVVILLVLGAAWYLIRTILTPIRAVTEAAHAIGHSKQLDKLVPVFGRDELGQLAETFNAMTQQLREYRMTNLSKLLRAQRTAQATVDSFPDPVLVLDTGGRVELANPAARQVLGVGPAIEGNIEHVWQPPESLRQSVQEVLSAQRSSAAESFDQAITFRTAGEEHSYLPQVRPIRSVDGDILGAAVVLADVTRFRLLDQFKTDLVATVSHELKTPLTSVRLAVHILLEERVGSLTAKQTELLVDARDNAERLLVLIDQLLSLAKLQRPEGEERRQDEPPEHLLRLAADTVRPRAEDKHVELVIEPSTDVPTVRVDVDRMATALGNLVQNAITYTPAGGHVTLSTNRTADDRVELTVSDTGVGIPVEHLPHIFDRFFRIPGQSNPAGTGLGLAIVKEVVTAHGGEIAVESEPGRGTCFRITLPPAGRVP